VFNILSQGVVPSYQGLSYQQMRNRVSQDVFKNALWGRPIGYFWHVNELRPDEVALKSTANGAGGLFYEEWQRAEETGYTRHFFPWWFDAAYAIEPPANFAPLTEEEAELAAVNGLKPEQIAWRRKQWASLRGLAVQEYAEDPVSCFRASGECVFDVEAVEQALQGSGEPLETRDNQRLMIWLPAQPGREYVIGVDPAGGGVEGDYSCAEVIDRELGTQCAELHGHCPPRELAQKLVKLGKEYNTTLLAVERNNHGYGVLACLRTLEYPLVFAQQGQDRVVDVGGESSGDD